VGINMLILGNFFHLKIVEKRKLIVKAVARSLRYARMWRLHIQPIKRRYKMTKSEAIQFLRREADREQVKADKSQDDMIKDFYHIRRDKFLAVVRVLQEGKQ